MNKIVPLISSGVAGPLGALHLPRLWLKASLEACGKLADGYPGIGPGYDMMTLNNLAIDPDAVRAFIEENRPTYPEFEEWVKLQPGARVDKASVHKHNLSILGYIHSDDVRAEILAQDGLPDDGSVLPDAVSLNNLDDWHLFYQSELA